MPIKKFKDIQLYYDEYGTGDRYLLCASQYHSKYTRFTIYMAEHGFHVYNITIRGYGLSTHVIGEGFGNHWYDVWSQDILDFADAMGIDKFFYAGVSHGAGIGWYICRYHPERCRGFFAVVGGPHSKDGVETSEARMRTINTAKDPVLWKQHIEGSIAKLKEKLATELSDYERKLVEERLERMKVVQPEEEIINPLKPFPEAKTEEALIKELEQVKTPTIMIGGMKDGIIFPENLIRSCKAVEASKLIIYQDCGHNVAEVRMQECIRDILQFCEDRKLY